MSTQFLYHLSKKKLVSDTLVPRVPKSDYEDQKKPRICFAPSIQGCLIGINEDKDLLDNTFYVYGLKSNDYYVPTMKEVADVKATGEVWVTKPVKVHYIGKIKVVGLEGTKKVTFLNKQHIIPIWKYKFIK